MTLILHLHHWDQGLRIIKLKVCKRFMNKGKKIDLQSNFSLFDQDPIYILDAIKEK